MTETRPYRILLVDDEQPIINLFRAWLEDSPYTTLYAESAEEALEYIQNDLCDIIVSDVNMAGMSGIELLKHVKREYPDKEVIIVTGEGNVEMAVNALKNGAGDFLQKPLVHSKFKESVERAVRVLSSRGGDDAESGGHETSTMRIIKPGVKLDRYLLGSLLGFGSQAAVYTASEGGRDFKYAIKIQQLFSKQPDMKIVMERIKNEAAALKKIDHPNIVKLIDSGYTQQDGTDVFYLVTEFVDGCSLDALIGKPDKEFPMSAKISIIHQVSRALDAIHEGGLTHRDIKPSNILVDKSFNVKITDFGICRMEDSNLTCLKSIVGTPMYLSPEYISDGIVNRQLDIYSLGIVSYMMLLNIPPYQASTYNDLIMKIVNEYPVRPTDIIPDFPVRLQDIIGKMLNKKASRRYQNAGEIADDLETLSNDPGSGAGFFESIRRRLSEGRIWK